MNRVIAMILGCLLTQNMAFAQTPIYPNDKNWQLKWEDNFNDTLNTNIWKVFDNFDHYGESSTVHIASNVYINDGTLVLRAKKEDYCCPHQHVGQWGCKKQWQTGVCYKYTGAWIETQTPGWYDTPSGYIEARIKMTYTPGVGYAFWTFARELSYSNPAEIDIFETMVPEMKQAKNNIATNVHTCYKNAPPGCKESLSRNYSLPNSDYTDWHIYAVEWDATKITWYVDGTVIRTIPNHNLDDFGNSIVDPVRIILGAHVDPKKTNATYLEHYMYVDHVKVYQLKCSDKVVNEISDFGTYCYTVKKSITLSGATTIPAGSNISLRATDYIELKSGFEVPLGAKLYLDINSCSGSNYNCPPSPY